MSRNGSGTYSLPVNSWNPAINGNSATATDWQSLINDVASALTQSLSSDGQTPVTGNLQMGANKLVNLAAGAASGDSLAWQQLFSQGAPQDVASAATVDVGAVNSVFLNITGTTTITSLGTNYNGPRFVKFSGILTLTNGASLALPGGGNITTAAGDCAIFVPSGSPASGWVCVSYQISALAPGVANTATNLTGPANISSMNGGQLAGFRNKIINGGCSVSIYGSVALSNGSVTYGGANRLWGYISGGSASGTLSQSANPVSDFSVTGYCQKINYTVTGTSRVEIATAIESFDSVVLNSKTIMVSANVYHDTGSSQNFYIKLSTPVVKDVFSSLTALYTSSAIPVASGATTRIEYPKGLASSDATNGLLVEVYFEPGAQTNKNFYLSEFQLEIADQTTPKRTTFETRPISVEFDMCCRFARLQTINAIGVATGASQAIIGSASIIGMRAGALSVTQKSNNTLFSQSNVSASTSSYFYDSSIFSAYRNSSGAGQAQFSEQLLISNELQ